jgi:hypothetical protein
VALNLGVVGLAQFPGQNGLVTVENGAVHGNPVLLR